MSIRYVDILLEDNYNLRNELKKAFGIGVEKAGYIADSIGLGKSYITKYLNRFFEDCLNYLTLVNYYVNFKLDSLLKQHFMDMMQIKLRKALRLSKGLTARGQGTRSNSKQNRFYLINKWQEKKEEINYDVRGSRIKDLKLKSKKKKK